MNASGGWQIVRDPKLRKGRGKSVAKGISFAALNLGCNDQKKVREGGAVGTVSQEHT